MIWIRPGGEGGISPLACPDFHGNAIGELKQIRNEREREALEQQRNRLLELRSMTTDEQTHADLGQQIAAIESALKDS